jgi:hypothetical protein
MGPSPPETRSAVISEEEADPMGAGPVLYQSEASPG